MIILPILIPLVYTTHQFVVIYNALWAIYLYDAPIGFFLRTNEEQSGLWPDDINVTGRVSCHTKTQAFPSCLTAISPLLPRPCLDITEVRREVSLLGTQGTGSIYFIYK